MTVGFEVFNDQGYKIAGNDLPNLCFYGKGRVNVPREGLPRPMAPGGVMNFYRSQYPLIEIGGRLFLSAGSGTQGSAGWVDYWSFGPVSPPDIVTSYGLEIYAEDGTLTFNTARPFLKLLGRAAITRDHYEVITKQGWRSYLDFTEPLGFQGGSLAFAIGNTRVYWTSQQFVDPQRGRVFTDAYRFVRGMHIDTAGRFASATLNTAVTRYSGSTGNFNYSPNGAAPLTMLVADVSGL